MSDAAFNRVTFLFTDIEGSTRLWEEHPEAMPLALARHDALVTAGIQCAGGRVVKSRGEGDSFFGVFDRAIDAATAALSIQQALLVEPWPAETPIRVRMAIHSGEAHERENDFYGPVVNRCARLRGAAHGGQVLLSGAASEEIGSQTSVKDLGLHRLPDLLSPVRVMQLLHSSLPAEFPPLRSLEAFRHNLPIQVSSFIGREREMATLKRLLENSRLLTLTGTGGCGKTRLAVHVAADVLPQYPDGVWLVELAALTDGQRVVHAIAEALGRREEPNRPLLQTLTDRLRSRSMLLILDNCEHLVHDCAQVVATLMRSCPAIRVMATSREPLGISGETAWRLPSLAIPGADVTQVPGRPEAGSWSVAVDEIMQYEAVRLFSERAEAALPEFALSERNAAAVARVCHRLDGIPLAIELAAARVRAMSVDKIAERVDDRFRLLTGGSRDALPRHQTLRAAVDWSYDLLSGAERTLLQRLSVFAGGWTLEAAEVVCAGGLEAEVLDLLTALVEKSLVTYGDGEHERYRLLETVRQYAGDRLRESSDAASVDARHGAYYLELAEKAFVELWGPDQVAWLERLDAEHENLRAALQRASGTADELCLAGALWRFWEVRGHTVEARAHLTRALAVSGGSAEARARALTAAGEAAWLQGDFGSSEDLHREGLALWRQIGCPRGTAIALNGLASQAHHPSSESLIEEAVGIAMSAQEWGAAAFSLNCLGEIFRARGELTIAEGHYTESLRLARLAGDVREIVMPLYNLGMIALNQGDRDRSRALLREGLGLERELRDLRGIAASLEGLAAVALIPPFPYSSDPSTPAAAEARRAVELLGTADALREAMNSPVEATDLPDYERTIAATREVLEEAEFEHAWARGRRMSLNEAIELAAQPPQDWGSGGRSAGSTRNL